MKETHSYCLLSKELVEVRDVDVDHRKPSPGLLGPWAEYTRHLDNLINLRFVNCPVGRRCCLRDVKKFRDDSSHSTRHDRKKRTPK